MDLYDLLLRSVGGLHRTTVTFLNGNVFKGGGLKILLFNAYQRQYFCILSRLA